MKCKKCNSISVKNGNSSSGIQRYRCKMCGCNFQKEFIYTAYENTIDRWIIDLLKEGCGISITARLLKISSKTVIRRILKIGNSLHRPYTLMKGKSYQVDELFTYLKNKDNRICIAYSLEESNGNVIDAVVGRRNKSNLNKIISPLILSNSKRITTDKLNIYEKLIPKSIHSTKYRGINKIERKNLNLRKNIKRLNRKTICYSKSLAVLTATIKIYFWG